MCFLADNLDKLQEKLQFQYGVSFDLICKYMYKGRDQYNKVNYTWRNGLRIYKSPLKTPYCFQLDSNMVLTMFYTIFLTIFYMYIKQLIINVTSVIKINRLIKCV